MVRSLNSGVSGIQNFQQKLDVIGNNIANSNTLGFKSGRADFEDAFSQSLSGGANANSLQVGSGVTTGTVRSLFQQGTLTRTDNPTDLAIENDGFFTVRDAVSGKTFVTRAGDFSRDSEGYLITTGHLRVQGYSDAGLSTRGDIKIDDTGKPDGDTSAMKNFSIGSDGKIKVVLASGQTFTRGQVLLQRFQDPGALIKEGNNLFSGIEDAGPLGQIEAPDTNGLGTISAGHLEMSNVDLAGEFASLITTQRGFQASARIITTTDEMLQEVVNLKR